MIDVIIPAYNAHETIERTLYFIAYQRNSENLNVYIINDNSIKDYSKEIDFLKNFINIRELKLKENSDPGYARQYGIEHSDSEYIIFIDSDDVFATPLSLITLENAIKTSNSDVVVSAFIEEKTKDVVNIMTSQDITLLEGISAPFIEQCINKKSLTNIIINAENFALNDKIKSYPNYFEGNFNNVFDAIKKYINDAQVLYNSNNGNKNVFDGKNKVNCVIIGISSFINKISLDRKNEMNTLFTNLADLGVINFVIIDTIDKIKKFTYDSWFKDNYNSSNGIYLGNGLGEQILINTNKRIPEMKEDVPYNFGFVIKRGIPNYVKFIEQM